MIDMMKSMIQMMMVDHNLCYNYIHTRSLPMFPTNYKKSLGLIFLLFSAGFAVWYPLANLL